MELVDEDTERTACYFGEWSVEGLESRYRVQAVGTEYILKG